MGRRKKGRDISGWLILDKPQGMTSTHAVARVRRLFGAKKAGHAGTLDPLATGLLPIALGEATKTISYAMESKKEYVFSIGWGIETTTDDTEGEPTNRSDHRPSEADILSQLPNFTGTIMQVPPNYSAKKIDGERAYDLARDGEVIELQPNAVEIHRLTYLGSSREDNAVLEACCGKGTYIRAIARDLGRALGCYGHVTDLRRTVVGAFAEDQAVSIDQLEQIEGLDDRDALLLDPASALVDLPSIHVNSGDAAKLRRGMSLLVRGREIIEHGMAAYAVEGDELVAIGRVDYGKFLPKRVVAPAG
ncbi:MAG: tRNA pseudouridine(55) synthase TruB [Pseudomonadota bacterium]